MKKMLLKSMIVIMLIQTEGVSHILSCVHVRFGTGRGHSNKVMDQRAINAVAIGDFKFGQKLYEELKKIEKGNLLISSYSMSSVMAMLSLGAKGKTLDEIMNGMEFPDMKMLVEGYSNSFILIKRKENFTLETANKLFVMEGVQLLEDYVKMMRESFYAEVTQTDFAEKEGEVSRKLINDWVEEETNKKVKNLIPKRRLNDLTSIVLANAIYFKGDWASKFDDKDTREQIFNVQKGKSVRIQMMHQKGKFWVFSLPGIAGKLIDLPYKGNRVSFTILLPDEKFGLPDVEMSLSKITLPEILTKVGDITKQEVFLSLPKFKLKKTTEMRNILKQLGMPQIFSQLADFSGMTGTKDLHVSNVIHKAFIEVNEEGSEVAAATAVIKKRIRGIHSMPLVCDHPFMFFIWDKLTGMVLFTGRVVDPTLG